MKKIKLFSLLLAFLLIAPVYAEVYTTTEKMSPVKDSYVKFDVADVAVHGGETTIVVKYNGSEFNTSSRQGLFEYDFTPYLNDLSKISSLNFCVRASSFYPSTSEPQDLELKVQKVIGFTFTESQTNDVVSTNYTDAFAVTTEDIGSVPLPSDKNYTALEFLIPIDVTKVLAGVTAQNPKVVFSIKITSASSGLSPLSIASRENADPSLRPYIQVGLTSVQPYTVTSISDPIKDTYF